MSYRAGFVGLIGLPNSGKSTLMNALVGEKISIVTNKPQTTRRRVLGIHTEENFQAVFVDAPGVVNSSSGLNFFLQQETADVISNSDVLIAILNIDEKHPDRLKEITAMVEKSKKPWFAVINKTDLPHPHRVQMLRQELVEKNITVLSGSSTEEPSILCGDVIAKLKEFLPETPGPLFDEDTLTSSSVREICAEIVREKSFEFLHQEVPFGLAVRILKFTEDEGPAVKIYAEILVAKPNHMAIVVGKGARILKQIGRAARLEMEKFLGQKVFLDLKVAESKNWQKNPRIMKELGYVLGR